MMARAIDRFGAVELLVNNARTVPLGLQTIWSSTDDPNNRMRGSLHDALERGLSMGASYFEIYAVDVLNPALQRDLASLKQRLDAMGKK